MHEEVAFHQKRSRLKPYLLSTYVLLLIIVFSTLVYLQPLPLAIAAYTTFSFLLLFAYFYKKIGVSCRSKNVASVLSVIVIIISGLVFPNDIEAIEEMYVLIPLLYLFLFPGSFWPIIIAVALISAYIPSFGNYHWLEWAEDTSELMIVASFATVMTFFQQRSFKQMAYFKHDSYTDYLTGLYNRKRFMLYMNELQNGENIEASKNFALLTLDLDGFKKINDQLGHRAGDKLLHQVAMRMEQMSNENIIPFRTGGDDFAFLITCGEGQCAQNDCRELLKKSTEIAQQVIHFSEQPYDVLTEKYRISASVGIAFYPKDAEDIETLYSNADLAMRKSKDLGRNCYSFYDNAMMQQMARRYALEDALKSALVNNELHLLYQPKVCLHTGKIVSAEALLRWENPVYGTVSPMEFIPIAESSLMIIPIGNWVLEQVCLQIAKWQHFDELETIAANVSSVQLTDSNFIDNVKSILVKTNCDGKALEIEQTESWLMDDPSVNIKILQELKELNVTLSLDDFGTAYSSLSQLGRLPLDILKIDKSFIDDCVHNHSDHMIVRTIIQLGHNLGMKIVAEGVEYEEQRQLLSAENCEYYQGYLFSKPVTALELEALLIKQNEVSNLVTSL